MRHRLEALRRRASRVIAAAARGELPTRARELSVLFHIGRCGSTVLAELLDQHPRLLWDGDLFNVPQPGRLPAVLERRRWRWTSSRHHPHAPLRFLEGAMVARGVSHYGFEIRLPNLEREGLELERFVRAAEGLGVSRFMVLERKNKLRQLLSLATAKETGRWHAPVGTVARPHAIRLDPQQIFAGIREQSLVAHFEDWDRWYAELRRVVSPERLLWLTYEEDLAADPRVGYRRVLAFLGLRDHPAEVTRSVTNPFRLEEMVTNLPELEAALAGTPYAWMASRGRGAGPSR